MSKRGTTGVWIVAAALLSGSALGIGLAAEPQSVTDVAAVARALPRATELSSSFRRVAELADRGVFFASGTPLFRVDDGNTPHAFAALPHSPLPVPTPSTAPHRT